MNRFWLNDLTTLFNRNNLLEIIPYSNLVLNQKLNSIFRLSIYFSIIMFILKRDYRYLMIMLIVGILTIIIHKTMSKPNVESNLSQDLGFSNDSNINDDAPGCILPTQNNPFMNPTLADYGTNLPPPPKSCPSYNNTGVQRRVEELFNEDLFE